MPRKRKGQPETYFKAFPTTLRNLIADHGITHQTLADQLGKSRQAISYYCDGSSSPDWETIVEIANYFSVSTDYLLGITDVKSPNTNTQAICSATGLSEQAICYLQTLSVTRNLPPRSNRLKILSALLEQKQFDYLLALWERYINLMQMEPSLSFSQSPEYEFYSAELKKQGFAVSLPDEQAQALFSERITNILRTLLDNLADSEDPY